MLNRRNCIALRMDRLRLPSEGREGGTKTLEDYDALFRDLSPVPVIGWCEPGSPPTLPLHAGFDDGAYNNRRRASREILKGRFGTRVAYVTREDLPLFACLYRRPLPRLTLPQERMLALLEREGPLNIGLIKEITGLPVKEITPVLHRLQEAFLVYEDQVDGEGDRGFYVFASEFPDVDLERYDKGEALRLVLPRLAGRLVFMKAEEAAAVYQQPQKEVRAALQELTETGDLEAAEVEGETGYLPPPDAALLRENELPPVRGVLPLQRGDVLVRAAERDIKASYPGPGEVLCGLLIDGEIRGVVRGRFKFGPHRLEDVRLGLPEGEQAARREEILDAVYTLFDRAGSPLGAYGGVPLDRPLQF